MSVQLASLAVHSRACRRAGALGAAALAAAAWPLRAAAQVPTETPVGGAVSSFDALDWLGLGLRLGLVILVIWGAVWAMRWYVRRVNGGAGGSGRVLHVLETRTLGPNRSLQLVRVGRRAVLVGVTPERVTHLLQLDDPDEVERLAATLTAPQPAPRPLDAVISRLGGTLSRRLGPRPTQRGAASPPRAAVARPGSAYGPLAAPPPLTPRTAPPPPSADSRGDRIAELQRAIETARAEVFGRSRR